MEIKLCMLLAIMVFIIMLLFMTFATFTIFRLEKAYRFTLVDKLLFGENNDNEEKKEQKTK